MDHVRREFWLHEPSNNLWAVEVSTRDESLLACCGPFSPRVAPVVALNELEYGRGPTLEWLRGRRTEFRRFDARTAGAVAGRRVAAPDPEAVSCELLDALLTEMRALTRAEAGTVYVREAEGLRFAAAHNEVLEARLGWVEARRRLTQGTLPMNEKSIASYVLCTHSVVNMPDAYDVPLSLPYVFNPQWDALNGYFTRSVLALPVRGARGSVFGVLQLINARDAAGLIVPFDEAAEATVARALVGWTQRLAA
jgi:hypothetical protein